jgi:hypothetical protein
MKNVGIAILIVMLSELALAAPMQLQMVVNNDSKECARFLPGDECMDCTPPEGWVILGPYTSCPENYKLVSVNGNCKGFEVEHCCTEKHSGASGDCRNLIKNDLTRECTFVTNATTDTIPDGWQKMPENATSSNWVCPLGYKWTTSTETIPASVAKYGPVNVVSVNDNADFQVSPGDYASGWTWLSQPEQSASWTFYNLPTDRKLYIYLTPLVTRPSGNGGGSGYSTNAKVAYETRTGSTSATIALKNTHSEFQMPADTFGWGYQTSDYLMIPENKIPFNGQLTITLVKLPNSEHVAVNKECCTIEYI